MRIGLKTLLIFVTLFCSALAFWTTQIRPYRDQYAAMQMVSKLGGNYTGENLGNAGLRGWLVRMIVDPAAFVRIDTVDLRDVKFENDSVSRLSAFEQLRQLDMDRSTIGDDGLKYLNGLKHLQHLSLRRCNLSDAGIAALREMPDLTLLRLTGNPISDDSVDRLKSYLSLKRLEIPMTLISDEGARQIEATLPACAVSHSSPLFVDDDWFRAPNE